MNKTELAAEVAERLKGVDPDARHYVDAVFDVIMGRVAAGERVQILGFGTFDSVERGARVGRNPRTGAAIQVAPSVSPRFHAGQTFRAQVTDGSPAAPEPSAAAADGEREVVKPAKAKREAVKAAKAKQDVVKPAKTAQDVVKPAKTKKPKAVAEKPVKKADKKVAKPAEKKSSKSVKAEKKSAKAAKTGKNPKK